MNEVGRLERHDVIGIVTVNSPPVNALSAAVRGGILECVKAAVGSLRMLIEARLSTGLASTPMGGARLKVAGGNWVTAKPVGVRNGTDLPIIATVPYDPELSAAERRGEALLDSAPGSASVQAIRALASWLEKAAR